MRKSLKIVFFGTPEFAVSSLQILVENQLEIVAVVTAPDTPRGRGKKLGSSQIKDYATKIGLPILQPTNLKSELFLKNLKNLQADLHIVVAFRMLPLQVWDMPPLGTFNLHASLLPQYRGAAPINWAIINGDTQSGVTTFFLTHTIDTGEIIFQEKEPINENDTAGTLYEKLKHKGARLVLKTTRAIAEGTYPKIPQKEEGELKIAPKIFRKNCKIDWHQRGIQIRNLVRGLSPYPGAWSYLGDKICKIHEVERLSINVDLEIGDSIVIEDKLVVKTQDDILSITELQLEGKKKMKTRDFMRGHAHLKNELYVR